MTPKSEKAWAVYDPYGDLIWWTIKPTRRESIDEAEQSWQKKPWRYWYNRGHRCRKIRIEVVK